MKRPPALDGERRHLVEEAAQRVLVAGRLPALAEPVQVVGLLEGGERVELKALRPAKYWNRIWLPRKLTWSPGAG